MINCVVAGNTKSDRHDTVFFGGKVEDKAACVLNCVVDPEDILGAFKDYANEDYTPNPTGPLYNAGVTPSGWEKITDLAGNPRVVGKAVDIGCYEGKAAGFTIYVR